MASDTGAAELRAVAKYIRGADSRTRAAIKPLVRKSAQAIKVVAAANAKHPSAPRLSRAVTFDVVDGGLGAEIGPDQSISGLGLGFEFGSSHTPPHPFMMAAGDLEEPKFADAVEKAVGDAWENLP